MDLMILEQYYQGDPGSPIGTLFLVEDDGVVLMEARFPNTDNERLMDAVQDAIERTIGIKAKWTNNADPDFGFRGG